MKILMFISRYGPTVATSGPALSVREMVDALARDHDISIVSMAGSVSGRPKDFPVNQWAQLGNARLFYTDKHWRRSDRIVSILRREEPDLVYINSFFDHRSSLLPLLALRALPGRKPAIMLAPRGEMAEPALTISKGRKRLYRRFAGALGLHRNVFFHASGDQDYDDICREFSGALVGKAQDIGLEPPEVPPANDRTGNRLKLVFLGRINPMKNIDFALRALEQCREAVSFDIIGPIDDPAYHAACLERLPFLPDNVEVRFKPAVSHDRVLQELAQRDLLFMPSRSENFCHAINEALCVGTPVLISKSTNWTPYLGNDLSWALDTTGGPQAFAAKIDELARESHEARAARRAQIIACNPAKVVRDGAIEDTRQLFRDALEEHLAR